MSVRCPEGHLSESLDYCDTCGSPIGAAAPAAPGPDPGDDLGPEPQTCPHCGALNVADALFCEACGYDFTTGTPPMGSAPAPPAEPEDEGYAVVPASPDEAPSGEAPSAEAPSDELAEVGPDEDEASEQEVDEGGPDGAGHDGDDAAEEVSAGTPETDRQDGPTDEEPDPEPDVVPEEAPSPHPAPAVPAPTPHRRARHTPPSRALAEDWVVEVWIDPDWYAVQQTEEVIPSPGVPDVVLLTRSTALVGRPSGSLGARPEVDAGADSAVSRRHAQLTSDGRRWWIEDLDSSNGTFVGTVGEPLPSAPIAPGQRVEIDRDDRIYVGAWTRLVLRQATASEQRGTG